MAVYPAGLFSWTARINNVDIVWANDPNSMSAEIISIEDTLGINPQIETGVSTGQPIVYATVSARIAALARGDNLPYVTLSNSQSQPCRHKDRFFHTYSCRGLDDFNMYNGSDITIPADGIWIVQADINWDSEGRDIDGFCNHFIYLNSNWLRFDTWRWDIPNRGYWPYDIVGNDGTNSVVFLGPLKQGDRIQTMSVNGCSFEPLSVTYASLRAQMIRELPANTAFTTLPW